MVSQQEKPGIHCCRHGGGEQTGAGYQLEPERTQVLDRRSSRGRALTGQDDGSPVAGASKDRRDLATGPALMRLDDMEDESGSHRGIERVPAALEHRHGGL